MALVPIHSCCTILEEVCLLLKQREVYLKTKVLGRCIEDLLRNEYEFFEVEGFGLLLFQGLRLCH